MACSSSIQSVLFHVRRTRLLYLFTRVPSPSHTAAEQNNFIYGFLLCLVIFITMKRLVRPALQRDLRIPSFSCLPSSTRCLHAYPFCFIHSAISISSAHIVRCVPSKQHSMTAPVSSSLHRPFAHAPEYALPLASTYDSIITSTRSPSITV